MTRNLEKRQTYPKLLFLLKKAIAAAEQVQQLYLMRVNYDRHRSYQLNLSATGGFGREERGDI